MLEWNGILPFDFHLFLLCWIQFSLYGKTDLFLHPLQMSDSQSVTDHFVRHVAVQALAANEGLLLHGVHPFLLIPSFFICFPASCNLIPFCTQAPPPRQLTFPLIHSESLLGVNNYPPVSSNHLVSTGLIQLIKVLEANQQTDKLQGHYTFHSFYLLAQWLTCEWQVEHTVFVTLRQIRFMSFAHQQDPALCVSAWLADVAIVWILSTFLLE